MISEVAHFRILEGHEAAFEAAVRQAADVFASAPGCRGLQLHRCIEEPSDYQAVIRWDTVEDHTRGFRDSPLFREWRSLVGPHFAEAPRAGHFEVVMPPVSF